MDISSFDFAQAGLMVLIFWMLTTPHEFAHALVADRLGDDTPRLEGRVTLNPLAHVDWMGTVILPAVTALLGGGFLGWGRAVNTNPSRLRGGYNGLLMVALAGPASNVLMAALLALVGAVIPSATPILFQAAYLSLYLAVFNMLPVPPLDGSKMLLAARLPAQVYIEIGRYGFLVIMVAMFSTPLGRWMSSASYTGALALFKLFR
jgi:Zn-dependent protease